MKKWLVASVAFAMAFWAVADNRGIGVSGGGSPKTLVTGEQYLLAIGIDDYLHWDKLNTAVNDATAFSQVLKRSYGFKEDNCQLLIDIDATEDAIVHELERLSEVMRPEDSLIIFYAGHGAKNRAGTGHWIPRDGNQTSSSKWISNNTIIDQLKANQGRHILLISDSCFSGNFFAGKSRGLSDQSKVTEEEIRDCQMKYARQAITSGGDEPVSDEGFEEHSVFTYMLLEAMKQQDGDYLLPRSLFYEVKVKVEKHSPQEPQFGYIKDCGDNGGSFIFHVGGSIEQLEEKTRIAEAANSAFKRTDQLIEEEKKALDARNAEVHRRYKEANKVLDQKHAKSGSAENPLGYYVDAVDKYDRDKADLAKSEAEELQQLAAEANRKIEFLNADCQKQEAFFKEQYRQYMLVLNSEAAKKDPLFKENAWQAICDNFSLENYGSAPGTLHWRQVTHPDGRLEGWPVVNGGRVRVEFSVHNPVNKEAAEEHFKSITKKLRVGTGKSLNLLNEANDYTVDYIPIGTYRIALEAEGYDLSFPHDVYVNNQGLSIVNCRATPRPCTVKIVCTETGSNNDINSAICFRNGEKIGTADYELNALPFSDSIEIRAMGYNPKLLWLEGGLPGTPISPQVISLSKEPEKFTKKKLPIAGCNLELIWIPSGKHSGSSTDKDNGLHSTEISFSKGFLIGETEVSQKQYQTIMNENPSHHRKGMFLKDGGLLKGDVVLGDAGNLPVENITHYEAELFCKIVNETLKTTKLKCRLPTVREWEYAFASSRNAADHLKENYAWCTENSEGYTHEVGQKSPAGSGLYDMLGNVWEWCGPDESSTTIMPLIQSPATMGWNVAKGGAFNVKKDKLSAASLIELNDGEKSSSCGFRIVIEFFSEDETSDINFNVFMNYVQESTSERTVLNELLKMEFANETGENSVNEFLLFRRSRGGQLKDLINLKFRYWKELLSMEGDYEQLKVSNVEKIKQAGRTALYAKSNLSKAKKAYQKESYTTRTKTKILDAEEKLRVAENNLDRVKQTCGEDEVRAVGEIEQFNATVAGKLRAAFEIDNKDYESIRINNTILPEMKKLAWEALCMAWNVVPTDNNPGRLRWNDLKRIPEQVLEPGEELSIAISEGLNIEMVWIPSGEFRMGDADKGDPDEKNKRRVDISSGFWMGKFEITQLQYEQLMGRNPSYVKQPHNPVENVTWEEATEYCTKLDEFLASRNLECRLPTEAEWEYACRTKAPSSQQYSGGLSEKELHRIAWYEKNAVGKHHPVGSLEPNGWGLYDMHGNVYEWCSDWYAKEYPLVDEIDPGGPVAGEKRIYRGGGWRYYKFDCRSAKRNSLPPGVGTEYIGFRIVVTPAHRDLEMAK